MNPVAALPRSLSAFGGREALDQKPVAATVLHCGPAALQFGCLVQTTLADRCLRLSVRMERHSQFRMSPPDLSSDSMNRICPQGPSPCPDHSRPKRTPAIGVRTNGSLEGEFRREGSPQNHEGRSRVRITREATLPSCRSAGRIAQRHEQTTMPERLISNRNVRKRLVRPRGIEPLFAP